MNNYFYLQLKKITKVLPFVIALTMVLIIGFATILYGMLDLFKSSESNQRFTIGVVGDTDNEYLRLGITAMQAFDETRFSIDIKEMTENQAEEALEYGEISSYIVVPKNFVENALSGDIDPITFVTSSGMEGINGLFAKEITALVTEMVIYSQKGTYGLYDALSDNGLKKIAHEHMNKISVEYAKLIFERNKMYDVNETGVSDGLTTPQYYVCAITLLLLILIGLPFALIYIKKDYSFNQLLVSRRFSITRQILLEYLAHLVTMLLLVAIMIVTAFFTIKFLPELLEADVFKEYISDFIIKLIPIIIMLSAFNFMMFEFSDNIVSGMLLHFFTALSLSYVSGCMYPIYAFPDVIQKIALFLPTGIARAHLSTAITLDQSTVNFIGLMLYSLVFLAIAWFTRFRKTVKIGGR